MEKNELTPNQVYYNVQVRDSEGYQIEDTFYTHEHQEAVKYWKQKIINTYETRPRTITLNRIDPNVKTLFI